MVYAFFVGLFLGLPVGCYLREAGYQQKFRRAYQQFSPDSNEQKKDLFTNKS